MTAEEAIEFIWLSGEDWCGLEWELTWMLVSNLKQGYSPKESLWHAMRDWAV